MKIEFVPSPITKGLYIPPELSDKTSLKDADSIDVCACDSAMLLLDKKMNPWQLVEAVDMLNTVTTSLIMRLKRAARDYEESCRQICVPEELLKLADIPFGAPLDIMYDEGEIYITVRRAVRSFRTTARTRSSADLRPTVRLPRCCPRRWGTAPFSQVLSAGAKNPARAFR